MIVVGFIGQTVTDSLLADLSQRNLSGVILSGANGNLKSPGQIQELTFQLRSVAQTPPLIAVDQEGGVVARLNGTNGFAATVSAFTLGTTYASLDSTRKQAALMASWVSSSGMNIDFAPVVDVNVNPSSPAIGHYGRSFSADPYTVAAHAQTFVDEFHAAHLMTSLKHFPGHGSATTDSHLTLPDITSTWSSMELIPYRELLKSKSIDVVMVGHLFNALIDSVYPTSLSRLTVQGLLRDSLHYSGVVITDDMYNMAAITKNYGFWDAAERSINAGVDVLLYVSNTLNNASLTRLLIDTLESKVQRGLISEARVNEASVRIAQLKNRYLVTGIQRPNLAASTPPVRYELTNYPNPFNPSTNIHFEVPFRSHIRVSIYNNLGQRVAEILSEEKEAGKYERIWNARVPSGVYYCRLEATSADRTGVTYTEIRKMILLR
jgi:beta-N-acetylhexosaminidase